MDTFFKELEMYTFQVNKKTQNKENKENCLNPNVGHKVL